MSQEVTECYLGLGSNVGDPVANIKLACSKISEAPAIDLMKTSPLYQSSAMTLEAEDKQPDYVNAVVKCMVSCPPLKLLSIVKSMEQEMGRIANAAKWAARIIDIDILLMEEVTWNSPELKLPHPGLTLRPFVLYPLRDLAPKLQLPGGLSIQKYADSVKDIWNTTLLKSPLNELIAK
ncbi:MAG: 2-amino-4-hydroxy-6-hydroxymethyldihydropteridine diphosphokinase [Candidatus Portiera sp.]|nr:2-amino-4-hydroxy-6-hydroxymethyldihydropteridine diphosphokinase [Portiera sp.]